MKKRKHSMRLLF